jgi:hypothetical protein
MKLIVLYVFIFFNSCTNPNQFLGIWQYSQKNTWMQTSPQIMMSTIEIKKINKNIYLKVEINGHHTCYAEGFVRIHQESLVYQSNQPVDNQTHSDAPLDNPCSFKTNVIDKKLKISEESNGCRFHCGSSSTFSGIEFTKK